jgi:hypothetical protein
MFRIFDTIRPVASDGLDRFVRPETPTRVSTAMIGKVFPFSRY